MIEIQETKNSKKLEKAINKQKHRNQVEDEIDINNVKRKTRGSDDGDPGPSDPRKKKGKEREAPIAGNQFAHYVPPVTAPITAPRTVNKRVNGESNSDIIMLDATPKRKKVVRKKQPLNTMAVNPPNILQLLQSSSNGGVSLLQYLAKDRDAARQLSQDLAALHRKKELNNGRRIIVNELRNAGLLDEDALSDTDGDTSDEYSSEIESSQWGSEGFDSISEESENDDDTVIDYPFDLNGILKGKPVRALITINDFVVTATIDSGAGASVISQSLVNKLKLTKTNVKKKFALTGFNNAVSESNQVVINADVRIGGKLRREHFCVVENIKDRDIYLLGRTWLKKHNITVASGQDMLIVPVGKNLNSYLEVSCVVDEGDDADSDEDDSYSTSMTPIYAVYVAKVNDEDPDPSRIEELPNTVAVNSTAIRYDNAKNEKINLDLYHEDVLSSFSKEGNSKLGANGVIKEEAHKEAEELPKIVQDILEKYTMVFYENAGLGRVKGVFHEIVTTTEAPIRTRPYRLTRDEEESLEEELKTLLELGIIEPSN